MPPSRKRAKKTHSGDGRAYLSQRIVRTIEDTAYSGTITEFYPRHNLWGVTYDDGDVEDDLTHEEILLAIDAHGGPRRDASYVGRRVSRKFGRRVYHGSVDGFDKKDRLWHVLFDDGDEEELDHVELLFALDLYDCTHHGHGQSHTPKKKKSVNSSSNGNHGEFSPQNEGSSCGMKTEEMDAKGEPTTDDDDDAQKPPPSSRQQQSFTIPIMVAILAHVITVLWLCKQMMFANASKEEQFLRSTGLLKFQPDKFQGARKGRRYFEGWYYKLVGPLDNNDVNINGNINEDDNNNGSTKENGVVSMAVVPGIFYGQTKKSNESHAFVFVTINGEKQHYYRYPTSDFSYSKSRGRDEYYIQVGQSRFTHEGMSLNLIPKKTDDAELTLVGELDFVDPSPWPVSLTHLGAMGPVGWVPFLECTHGILSFDHVLRGSLTMTSPPSAAAAVAIDDVDNGEEVSTVPKQTSTVINFDNGRGYTEKDFGRSFPSLWVWIQSNSFRNNPGTSLFVSIARIPVLGVLEFPGFTAAVWHNSTLIPFATWSGAAFEDIRISDEEVYVAMRSSCRNNGVGYRVELTVDRRNVPEVLLYAPVNFTKMAPFVREALQAKVHMRLYDGSGNVIVDDVGEYAGLEVHGDVQWLVDNVCGKETANKVLCL